MRSIDFKAYKFRKIIRNRDREGYILTYSAEDEYGHFHEVNTLKEAKVIAAILIDEDPAKRKKKFSELERLLRSLNI